MAYATSTDACENSKVTKQELQSVIDEMNNAYEACYEYNCMNADYAEFAIMALDRFRRILGNPSLTKEELRLMLRTLIAQHREFGAPGCWKGFVAAKMASVSNTNTNNTHFA